MALSSEIDAYGTVSEALRDFPSEIDVPEPIEKFLDGLTQSHMLTSTRIDASLTHKDDAGQKTESDPRETYKAQIRQLEEEIYQLEAELDEEEYKLLEFSKATLDEVEKYVGVSDRERPDAITDDDELLNKIELQEKFTGFKFMDVTCKITSQSDEKSLRMQTLTGRCADLEFAVTFEVEESRIADKSNIPALAKETHKAVVTSLLVELPSQKVSEDLQTFVAEVEERCALQPFFRGFQEYATLCHKRRKFFQRLEKKYPDAVMNLSEEDESVIQFHHPVLHGVLYTVVWAIEVAAGVKVMSNVTLDVKARHEMHKLDKRRVLQTAPEQFEVMLEVMGQEKAIETLIKFVATL